MNLSNIPFIREIISGERQFGVYRHRLGWSYEPLQNTVLLAGSFCPLHRAHRALLKVGLEIAGSGFSPCFEISVLNVEKPDIAPEDLESRLKQFQEADDILVVTRAATFLEKTRLMPGTTFVIGYDTAIRLFDDNFYHELTTGSPSIEAMSEIRDLGARFIVGGRHDEDGHFRTVRDIAIPSGFDSLLIEVPEAVFSDSISSTQLRDEARRFER